MENVVITIARQYGSGGKTIGKMLAEDLGIPFYDRKSFRWPPRTAASTCGCSGRRMKS